VSAIHTEIVTTAHAYTRSRVPWEQASEGVMRAHGRSVRDAERLRRQGRFALLILAFAVLWTLFYFL